MVAESVDYSKRNRVIVTDLDFPTLVYQWRVKPEVEAVLVRSEDGISIDPAQISEVVDERTAFVATSHVYYSTGHVQDVSAVTQIARDAGAYSVIDAYQAPGQIPVDVEATGADFYTWGPLKWLCGGPGLSYLYVRPELIDALEPRITSWWANRDQFAFDLEHFEYRDDALRFELGTPPLPSVHLALGGQSILAEVGIERIAARNRELADRVVSLAEAAGFDLRQSADLLRRSAIVMIRHADAAGAVRALAAQDIIVDYRGDYVRVSPHFYNTEGEVDRCIHALSNVSGRA
jgi:selenocysteine lyase/cysteine desulfurase